MSLAKMRSVLHQHGLTKMVSSVNLGNMTDTVVSNNRTAIGIAQGYHYQTQRIPVVCLHKPETFWTLPVFPSIIFQVNPINKTNGPNAHIRTHYSDAEIVSAVRELKRISTVYQTLTYLYLDVPNNVRETYNIIPHDDAIVIPSNLGMAFAIGVSAETHKTVIIQQNEITDDIRYMPMARNMICILTYQYNFENIKKYYDKVYVVDNFAKQSDIIELVMKCKIGKYAIISRLI